MKLFEDLPSQNTPINAENLNQIQDNLVVVSTTEPTGDNREKVWIQKGKNLFNPQIPSELGSCIVGLDKDTFSIEAIGSDMYVGQVVNEGINYRPAVGQLIPVTPNSNITVSCTAGIFNNIFITSYNENKVSLGYVNSKTILTSSDTKYISVRFGVNPASIGKTYTTQVQVEQGSTATEYEEYIEPKIYVKNDNGVYEEFYKGNKEVVLFQGSELGDINLADSTYNYKYIEVFFSSVSGENDSVKVLSDSTVINCNSVLLDNGIADDNGYIFIAKQLINMGTTLTIKATGRLYKYQKSAEIIQDTLNQLYINKVIGYKE